MVEPPCSEPSPPREVLVGGPRDTGGRDAALVEEVPVLGGEHRVDHRLRDLVVLQHLPVGGAEPADEAAVLGVDHGLREAGGRHRRGGNRRLLVGDGHGDRAEHDDAADDPEQDAQGLAQRPVPPPAALDLDPGRSSPRRPGPARPRGPRGLRGPPGSPGPPSRAPRPGPPRPVATGADRAAAVATAPAPSRRSGVNSCRWPRCPSSAAWIPLGPPTRARGCRHGGPWARGRDRGAPRCRRLRAPAARDRSASGPSPKPASGRRNPWVSQPVES